ncbi:MAG: hypothetical protein R2912_02985 [Eubacteriales bacterium]
MHELERVITGVCHKAACELAEKIPPDADGNAHHRLARPAEV